MEGPWDGGIFEAAKSAKKSNPVYTTMYAQYPENAAGNPPSHGGVGRPAGAAAAGSEGLEPNMDQIIAHAKFTVGGKTS